MEQFNKLIYQDLTYRINGILFYVQNELGRYCNEKQYCDSIESNLKKSSINFEREKFLSPSFEGEKHKRNKVDFLIENKLVLEIKAKRLISKEDYYQIKRYLQALKIKLGILVNFRSKFLHPKRILNSAVSE